VLSCCYQTFFNETFTCIRHHMSMLNDSNFWQGRLKAAGIHLAISLAVAALAALLVFFVWYPYPYREVSGGRELFLIVMAVDVVLGPLITLAVFSPNKPKRLMRFDFVVIGALQLCALGYGLWVVAQSRPVHVVFEVDRFVVVHAIEVPRSLMDRAPEPLQKLPLTGPTFLSIRDSKNNQEKADTMFAELAGLALATRPDYWQAYDKAKTQIIAKAKPVADLKARFPTRAAEIDSTLKSAPINTPVGYLPLVGRNTFWTVLINTNTAELIGFVPIDTF
jgi:hypothetical protein